MTGEGKLPRWVVPSGKEADDLFLVAHQMVTDVGSLWAQGITTTLLWVRGGILEAPISGRQERPVSHRVALVESYMAQGMLTSPASLRGMKDVSEGLGVEYLIPPFAMSHRYALGVYQTLEWLMSLSPENRPVLKTPPPPLPIPLRERDGSTPTAGELFSRKIAAEPYLWSSNVPESITQDLHRLAEAEEKENRRMAESITATEHRLARAYEAEQREGLV
ncbi:MAG: hypothetical protein ACRDRR_19910 [Pseudonocardiaceae bacterium]